MCPQPALHLRGALGLTHSKTCLFFPFPPPDPAGANSQPPVRWGSLTACTETSSRLDGHSPPEPDVLYLELPEQNLSEDLGAKGWTGGLGRPQSTAVDAGDVEASLLTQQTSWHGRGHSTHQCLPACVGPQAL